MIRGLKAHNPGRERLPDGTKVRVRSEQFKEECEGVITKGEYDDGWLYRIEVTAGDRLDALRTPLAEPRGLWNQDAEGELWVCDFEVQPIGGSAGTGTRSSGLERKWAGMDYERIARWAAGGAGGARRRDETVALDHQPLGRGPLPEGEGRGRWLALDTMDHIVSCIRRSQRSMSAGGVQDGANLVRMAFEELRSLNADLGKGVLTDDAWDV